MDIALFLAFIAWVIYFVVSLIWPNDNDWDM